VDASDADDHSTTTTIEHSPEPRLINGNDSVLVLQFRVEGRDFEIQNHVALVLGNALALEADTPKGSTGWVFYLALERPHVEGLSTWLGIGKGVPPRFVDMLQKLLEGLGHRVLREHAIVAHHDLHPFVAVTDTGLDVPPVGPTSLDEYSLRHFEIAKIVRRPFVLNPVKASALDQMLEMLLGSDNAEQPPEEGDPLHKDEIKPDLGVKYLEAGCGDVAFRFSRLAFHLIARVDEDLYTMMSTLPMEQSYALSIDFDEVRYRRLLALLPANTQTQFQKSFSGPFSYPQSIDVPPGALVAGVRAKLGELQINDDERYVPFVAQEFLPPAETISLTIEEEP
jgi:hypothetical protein